MTKYHVPADVPNELVDTFIQNMDAATAGTGKMNLFACDQKIEHLNDDFMMGEIQSHLHQMTQSICLRLERDVMKMVRSEFLQVNWV